MTFYINKVSEQGTSICYKNELSSYYFDAMPAVAGSIIKDKEFGK